MEITMRAFKGTFKKKNGESRNMVFAKISDLPQSFLSTTVLGAGSRGTNLAYNGVSVFGDETNVEMLSSLTPLLGVPSHPLTAGINQISKEWFHC